MRPEADVLAGNALGQLAFSRPPYSSSMPFLAESPARVLLVDDEPRILSSLAELLKGRGFVLTSAANGIDAIQHLNQEPFDLVILDLRLPDMSGHDIMDFMNTRQTGAT